MALTVYSILQGVGDLYLAAQGTTFPLINAVPASTWVKLGLTDGGVKITHDQKTTVHRSDQRTGGLKATRQEEDLYIETKLEEATLENLAKVLGLGITVTAASAGVAGTRVVNLHMGSTVTEYSLLFRGETQSPYGLFPAQYQLPRGWFDGVLTLEHKKDGHVLYTVKFSALEDLNASSESERFGKLVVQDSAPL